MACSEWTSPMKTEHERSERTIEWRMVGTAAAALVLPACPHILKQLRVPPWFSEGALPLGERKQASRQYQPSCSCSWWSAWCRMPRLYWLTLLMCMVLLKHKATVHLGSCNHVTLSWSKAVKYQATMEISETAFCCCRTYYLQLQLFYKVYTDPCRVLHCK